MNVAIIAAAGQGVRMGTKRAKQFLELDGIPVIIHTLTRFEQCPDIDEVVVVLPEKDVKRFPALARKYGLQKVRKCIAGGASRAESVKLALRAIGAAVSTLKHVIVAVHDGVRPFVTPEEISQTIDAARSNRAAILVAPVTDTIKVIKQRMFESVVDGTCSRSGLRRALTPQCFDYRLLCEAYFNKFVKSVEDFTDDSMAVERGPLYPGGFRWDEIRIRVVEGNARNIKITQPEDLALAELILKQNPEFRIKKAQ